MKIPFEIAKSNFLNYLSVPTDGMFMHFIIILFLSLFLHNKIFCIEEWISLSRNLRDRINNLYRRKISYHDDCISVGPRSSTALDFPVGDKNKTNIIRAIWRDYYKCLKSKSQAVQKYGTLPPYTVTAFRGSSVQLDCNVCISPEDTTFVPEWRFMKRISQLESALVDEDDHREISAYTSALHFYNVQKYHKGLYYCKLTTDRDAPYILHVLDTELEPTRDVKPKTSLVGPHTRDPVTVPRSSLVVWNEWTDWTECSVCGKVGKRSRIGFCKISSREYLSSDILSKVKSPFLNETFDASVFVIEETAQLLKYFVYGIPCRSPLLKREFKDTILVRTFPTQVEIALCKVACPSSIMVEVLSRNGSVVETYNNSAGDYYALQELPVIPAGVKRVSLYANRGQSFSLPCPSKRDSNVPIEWSVNGKIWLKDSIETISKNRISVNNLNEITFQRVENIDAKIYSCWQNKVLVGVVRLRLNKTPSLVEEYKLTSALYPVFMILSILITLLYVTVGMILNREKARAASIRPQKRKETSLPLLQNTT